MFVEIGGSTVVATTTTSMPIAAGATEVVTGIQGTNLAAITASGTSVVYCTPGEGL